MDFLNSLSRTIAVGFEVLLLSYVAICIVAAEDYEVLPEYNICSPKTLVKDPPTVYLEGPHLGLDNGQSTELFVNWSQSMKGSEKGCIMLIRTCSACQLIVEATGEGFSYPACHRTVPKADYDDVDYCSRECVYLKLMDGDYKTQTLKRVTSSSSLLTHSVYSSQSRSLLVAACSRGLSNIRGNVTMRIRLRSVAKHTHIEGNFNNSQTTITSPYFPNPYVKNSEMYTYTFARWNSYNGGEGFIVIRFDDWIISRHSKITFHTNDGNEARVYTGSDARPYLVTGSSSARMTFETGRHADIGSSYYSHLGFKAVVKFYRYKEEVPDYVTDCDELISRGSGGVIMPGRFPDRRMRDCIWVIKPITGNDGVYLKVLRYTHGWGSWSSKMGDNSLEVRAGLTSEAPQRMHISPSISHIPDYAAQSSPNGFYVRLRGLYIDGQPLTVAYSQFRFDCSSGYIRYYKCGNGRCIDELLRCDSYDHCGDSTDERYCDNDDKGVIHHESKDSYHASIGIIIPMVGAVFLIIIICLLVLFLRRCRRLNNGGSGSVCGLLGRGGRRRSGDRGQRRSRDRRRRHRGNHHENGGGHSVYGEYPPSYDEALHSAPVEMNNMAYSWSHPDFGIGQPPSYEDAMLESAAPPYNNNNNNNTGTSNSNSSRQTNGHTTSSRGSRSDSVLSVAATAVSATYPVVTSSSSGVVSGVANGQRPASILDPNLDPGAYVTSSSSSEASETEARLDMSSSSESSTDNENGFIPRSTPHSSRSPEHQERLVHQQQQIQDPTHSNRRSSSLSSVGGTPDNSGREGVNKLPGHGEGQHPVVKVQDSPRQKGKDHTGKEVDANSGDKEKGSSNHIEAESRRPRLSRNNDERPIQSEGDNRERNVNSSVAGEARRNSDGPSHEGMVDGARGTPSQGSEQRRGRRKRGRRRSGQQHLRSRDSSDARGPEREGRRRRNNATSNREERGINDAQPRRHREERDINDAQSMRHSEEEGINDAQIRRVWDERGIDDAQPIRQREERGIDDAHLSRHRLSPEGESQNESMTGTQDPIQLRGNLEHQRLVNSAVPGVDRPRPVKDEMRSQSCFNLSSDRAAGNSQSAPGLVPFPDKRYSYAGAGDAQLAGQRSSLSPLCEGGGLKRDPGLEGFCRGEAAGASSLSDLRSAEVRDGCPDSAVAPRGRPHEHGGIGRRAEEFDGISRHEGLNRDAGQPPSSSRNVADKRGRPTMQPQSHVVDVHGVSQLDQSDSRGRQNRRKTGTQRRNDEFPNTELPTPQEHAGVVLDVASLSAQAGTPPRKPGSSGQRDLQGKRTTWPNSYPRQAFPKHPRHLDSGHYEPEHFYGQRALPPGPGVSPRQELEGAQSLPCTKSVASTGPEQHPEIHVPQSNKPAHVRMNRAGHLQPPVIQNTPHQGVENYDNRKSHSRDRRQHRRFPEPCLVTGSKKDSESFAPSDAPSVAPSVVGQRPTQLSGYSFSGSLPTCRQPPASSDSAFSSHPQTPLQGGPQSMGPPSPPKQAGPQHLAHAPRRPESASIPTKLIRGPDLRKDPPPYHRQSPASQQAVPVVSRSDQASTSQRTGGTSPAADALRDTLITAPRSVGEFAAALESEDSSSPTNMGSYAKAENQRRNGPHPEGRAKVQANGQLVLPANDKKSRNPVTTRPADPHSPSSSSGANKQHVTRGQASSARHDPHRAGVGNVHAGHRLPSRPGQAVSRFSPPGPPPPYFAAQSGNREAVGQSPVPGVEGMPVSGTNLPSNRRASTLHSSNQQSGLRPQPEGSGKPRDEMCGSGHNGSNYPRLLEAGIKPSRQMSKQRGGSQASTSSSQGSNPTACDVQAGGNTGGTSVEPSNIQTAEPEVGASPLNYILLQCGDDDVYV